MSLNRPHATVNSRYHKATKREEVRVEKEPVEKLEYTPTPVGQTPLTIADLKAELKMLKAIPKSERTEEDIKTIKRVKQELAAKKGMER